MAWPTFCSVQGCERMVMYNRNTGTAHGTKRPRLEGKAAALCNTHYNRLRRKMAIGLEERIQRKGGVLSDGALAKGYWLRQEPGMQRRVREVRVESGGVCEVCGSDVGVENIEVDHRLALVEGGTNDKENLSPLCGACHRDKTRAELKARWKRRREAGRQLMLDWLTPPLEWREKRIALRAQRDAARKTPWRRKISKGVAHLWSNVI